MKITNIILALVIVTGVCAYTYDVNQPTKIQRPFSTKGSGGNDDAQLPYTTHPFAYDYDSKNSLYTVYFYVNNAYGETIASSSTWIYDTETYYLLEQRMKMEASLIFQSQAGDFETGLQYIIRNGNGLVCQ